MAGLAPADLQERVETALLDRLGSSAPPWSLSSQSWHSFPGADLQTREALSFAVGLVTSVALPGRQLQAAASHPSETTVSVRFAVQVSERADYRVALAREAELVPAALAALGVLGPKCRWVSTDRALQGAGTLFVGDARFVVLHMYPIGSP